MTVCWAPRCHNSNSFRSTGQVCRRVNGEIIPLTENVTFFKFPLKKPELLKKWLANIRKSDCMPTANSVLCSVHFLPSCFVTGSNLYAQYIRVSKPALHRRLVLKPGAVPTEFTINACPPWAYRNGLANVEIKDTPHIVIKAPTSKLHSIIKTEPFVDPTQETKTFRANLKSEEATALSSEYCGSLDETPVRNLAVSKCESVNPAVQVSPEELVTPSNNRALQKDFYPSLRLALAPTHVLNDINQSDARNPVKSPSLCPVKIETITASSTSNLYSTIKTNPFGDPTQLTETFRLNQTSGEVTASLQCCGSRDTTLLNPNSVFGCDFVDEAVQVIPGEIATGTRNTCRSVHSVSTCQFVDKAVQVCQENIVTATRKESKTVQTDFDPSTLIILDPTRVIVLDQSQTSEFHGSEIPGFDPTGIPGFDPSRIQGYDPCQDYRAVYVQWDEPIGQESQDSMNGDLPQSPDIQEMNVSSKRTSLQNLICSSENIMPNVEEVIRFTEKVEIARDKALEALKVLQESGCTCRSRVHKFIVEMQKMVDTARNDVITMIKQLAETTKQQQTQFLHLAGLVRKLHEEQSKIEGQWVKFKKSSLTVRCTSNRKRRLQDEDTKKTKFRKNIQISAKVSKIGLTKEDDDDLRQINTIELSQEDCQKKLTFSPGTSEAAKNRELWNICRTNNDKVRTKQQVNCHPITAEIYDERRCVK